MIINMSLDIEVCVILIEIYIYIKRLYFTGNSQLYYCDCQWP